MGSAVRKINREMTERGNDFGLMTGRATALGGIGAQSSGSSGSGSGFGINSGAKAAGILPDYGKGVGILGGYKRSVTDAPKVPPVPDITDEILKSIAKAEKLRLKTGTTRESQFKGPY